MPRGTKSRDPAKPDPGLHVVHGSLLQVAQEATLVLARLLVARLLGSVSLVLFALGALLLFPFLPRRGFPLLRLTLSFLAFVACKGARSLFPPALGFLSHRRPPHGCSAVVVYVTEGAWE